MTAFDGAVECMTIRRQQCIGSFADRGKVGDLRPAGAGACNAIGVQCVEVHIGRQVNHCARFIIGLRSSRITQAVAEPANKGIAVCIVVSRCCHRCGHRSGVARLRCRSSCAFGYMEGCGIAAQRRNGLRVGVAAACAGIGSDTFCGLRRLGRHFTGKDASLRFIVGAGFRGAGVGMRAGITVCVMYPSAKGVRMRLISGNRNHRRMDRACIDGLRCRILELQGSIGRTAAVCNDNIGVVHAGHDISGVAGPVFGQRTAYCIELCLDRGLHGCVTAFICGERIMQHGGRGQTIVAADTQLGSIRSNVDMEVCGIRHTAAVGAILNEAAAIASGCAGGISCSGIEGPVRPFMTDVVTGNNCAGAKAGFLDRVAKADILILCFTTGNRVMDADTVEDEVIAAVALTVICRRVNRLYRYGICAVRQIGHLQNGNLIVAIVVVFCANICLIVGQPVGGIFLDDAGAVGVYHIGKLIHIIIVASGRTGVPCGILNKLSKLTIIVIAACCIGNIGFTFQLVAGNFLQTVSGVGICHIGVATEDIQNLRKLSAGIRIGDDCAARVLDRQHDRAGIIGGSGDDVKAGARKAEGHAGLITLHKGRHLCCAAGVHGVFRMVGIIFKGICGVEAAGLLCD